MWLLGFDNLVGNKPLPGPMMTYFFQLIQAMEYTCISMECNGNAPN